MGGGTGITSGGGSGMPIPILTFTSDRADGAGTAVIIQTARVQARTVGTFFMIDLLMVHLKVG
jgi:hypothetical protein